MERSRDRRRSRSRDRSTKDHSRHKDRRKSSSPGEKEDGEIDTNDMHNDEIENNHENCGKEIDTLAKLVLLPPLTIETKEKLALVT